MIPAGTVGNIPFTAFPFMPSKKTTRMEKRSDADARVRKAIGSRIAQMRRKLHLNAADVAKELGLSREAVTHVETGRNNVSALALWKLAVRFGCNIQDLFPEIPSGHRLTKVDIDKLAQEDENAAEWAEEMFNK